MRFFSFQASKNFKSCFVLQFYTGKLISAPESPALAILAGIRT